MIPFKIFLIFCCCFLFVVDCKKEESCTASQSNNLLTCTGKFLDSLGFYENDGINGDKIITELTNKWSAVETMCVHYKDYLECLEPATIKNCIKKEEKSKETFIDLSPSAIYNTTKFVCQTAKFVLKDVYECMAEHCKNFDTSSCQSLAISLEKCEEISQAECDIINPDGYFVMLMGLARYCPKDSRCPFCKDSNLVEQIMTYRPKIAYNDEILLKLAEDVKNYDIEIQLNALSQIHEFLLNPRFPVNSMIETGFVPILIQCLSSKSPEIQLEAAKSLKYVLKSEHIAVVVESDPFPSLTRALHSTDEKLLEEIIEILAKLIQKQPELQNIYIDVVEPLLLSFSSEMPREMLHNTAIIIGYMCQNNENATKLKGQLLIEALLPMLAELIYSFNGSTIIETTDNLIKMALDDYEGTEFNADVILKIVDLYEHPDKNVRAAATLAVTHLALAYDEIIKESTGESILKKYIDDHKDSVNEEDILDEDISDEEDDDDTDTCTASLSNKLLHCSSELFTSLGFYETGSDPIKIFTNLATSWTFVEKFCASHKEMEECIGPKVMKNCVSSINQGASSMNEYLDFALSFVLKVGNYMCQKEKEGLKSMYLFVESKCEFDSSSSCSSIEKSINKCVKNAEKNFNSSFKVYVPTYLILRECLKNSECSFCPEEIKSKLKHYRSTGKAFESDQSRLSTAKLLSKYL